MTEERGKGHSVYFGDATSPAFLKACGLMEASGVIVTIHTQSLIDVVVREVRKVRQDILVVARARDAEHARHLYAIGVTDAVPETIEASLQLSGAALVGLGIPTGLVIATIHEQRDEFRHALQAAAKEAGLSGTPSVRAKKSPSTLSRRNSLDSSDVSGAPDPPQQGPGMRAMPPEEIETRIRRMRRADEHYYRGLVHELNVELNSRGYELARGTPGIPGAHSSAARSHLPASAATS